LQAPTKVAWAPDGRMFVVEKGGRLKVGPPGSTIGTTVLDLSARVNHAADRGLLGLAVDASFSANRFVYLLYTYDIAPLGGEDTSLRAFTLDGGCKPSAFSFRVALGPGRSTTRRGRAAPVARARAH